MINSSKLTKRLTIVKPTTSPDGLGGQLLSWADAGKCWAEMLRPRLSEASVQGDAVATVISQGFRIRDYIAVQKGWRVKCGDITYDILHIDTSVKYEQILTCKEVVR